MRRDVLGHAEGADAVLAENLERKQKYLNFAPFLFSASLLYSLL